MPPKLTRSKKSKEESAFSQPSLFDIHLYRQRLHKRSNSSLNLSDNFSQNSQNLEETDGLRARWPSKDKATDITAFHLYDKGEHELSITHALTSIPSAKIDQHIISEKALENQYTPQRFNYFSTDLQVRSADTFSSLFKENEPMERLFRVDNNNSITWWLDCRDVTKHEMKMFCHAFHLSRFTGNDIKNGTPLEKVEFHERYYFLCLRSFLAEPEKPGYLEPALVYLVVFQTGVISFHIRNDGLKHCESVRRRILELFLVSREAADRISPDWICYAIIHDILKALTAVIEDIEERTYLIGQNVFDVGLRAYYDNGLLNAPSKDEEQKSKSCYTTLLHKIGAALIDVMRLEKILQNKKEVLETVLRQCQWRGENANDFIQPRKEISPYMKELLGNVDMQIQALKTQQQYLTRLYNSYLAQLQVAAIYSSESMNSILSKITVFGAVFLPLSSITGFWGMSITVPGSESHSLAWFFGLLIGLTVLVMIGGVLTNCWINLIKNEHTKILNTTENLRVISRSQRKEEKAESETSETSGSEYEQILTPVNSAGYFV